MIRARASNGMFILGLDAENVRRLKGGKPILVSLAEMGGQDDVIIMYGDTLDDIQRELEEATGVKLPEPTPIDKMRKTS